MSFDPWKASEEEAIRATQDWTGENGLSPVARFHAARMIEAEKPRIDAGDGFAVLACIRWCVTHELVAPEWLAYAFNRRYDAVLSCRVGSWDDPQSFGRPYPKGRHLNALRKARINRLAVLNAVHSKLAFEPTTAIDKGLFEEVGKPLGLGATLAEELYYQAVKITRRSNTAKSANFAGIRSKKR